MSFSSRQVDWSGTGHRTLLDFAEKPTDQFFSKLRIFFQRFAEPCALLSDEKQLTTNKEKGAHNYIDNLMGAKLIEVWEMEALKHFFTKVRNPFGHGPGAAPMPSLTDQQTNWAIENSMIWIKSLIRRM